MYTTANLRASSTNTSSANRLRVRGGARAPIALLLETANSRRRASLLCTTTAVCLSRLPARSLDLARSAPAANSSPPRRHQPSAHVRRKMRKKTSVRTSSAAPRNGPALRRGQKRPPLVVQNRFASSSLPVAGRDEHGEDEGGIREPAGTGVQCTHYRFRSPCTRFSTHGHKVCENLLGGIPRICGVNRKWYAGSYLLPADPRPEVSHVPTRRNRQGGHPGDVCEGSQPSRDSASRLRA